MSMRLKFSYKIAWINLFFAAFIILWGAYVRMSGSGAGCGEHWPLCNGEVIPLSTSFKTFIEFTHRLTSGLFGFTILAQVYFAWKETSKGHVLRKMALAALVFTFIEALIGAVLVKKGLVVDNASLSRALVIGLHLINTLFLMATLVLCAKISKGMETAHYKVYAKLFWPLSLLMMMTFASGGVAALGNTLFPDTSLIDGVYKDFDSASHFLIRLRIYHPIMAILMSVFYYFFHGKGDEEDKVTDLAQGLVLASVAFGVINWLMMAPTWGALVHLLMANILWGVHIWKGYRYLLPV